MLHEQLAQHRKRACYKLLADCCRGHQQWHGDDMGNVKTSDFGGGRAAAQGRPQWVRKNFTKQEAFSTCSRGFHTDFQGNVKHWMEPVHGFGQLQLSSIVTYHFRNVNRHQHQGTTGVLLFSCQHTSSDCLVHFFWGVLFSSVGFTQIFKLKSFHMDVSGSYFYLAISWHRL